MAYSRPDSVLRTSNTRPNVPSLMCFTTRKRLKRWPTLKCTCEGERDREDWEEWDSLELDRLQLLLTLLRVLWGRLMRCRVDE